MDTQNDGLEKVWFLLNMAIFGIYVRFLGDKKIDIAKTCQGAGETLGNNVEYALRIVSWHKHQPLQSI